MTDNALGSLTTNAAATAGRAVDQAPVDNSPAAVAAVAQGNAAPIATKMPLLGPPIGTSDPMQLAAIGATIRDPVTQAARASLMGRGVLGFDAATALLPHAFVPTSLIASIRNQLHAVDQHGFNVASALRVGRTISAPDDAPSDARAAHAVRHGTIGMPPAAAVALVNTVAALSPNAVTGAQAANKQIDAARAAHAAHAAQGGIGVVDVALIGVGLAAGGWWWGPIGAGIGAVAGGAVDLVRRHFAK